MKIKKDFLLREVAGENIVIAVGDAARDFTAMIRLNSTGAFLWRLLAAGSDSGALLRAMLEKYDTDEATAKRDISAFLETVRKAGLLDE